MLLTQLKCAAVTLSILLILGFLAAGGCDAPSAKVAGNVTYQGKPVTSGLVVFIDAAGRATLPASVQSDGSFTISKAAVGPVKVSFDNPVPPRLPRGRPGSTAAEDPELVQMARAIANYTPTPAKYKDPAESGIEFDLKPGANVCDIELK